MKYSLLLHGGVGTILKENMTPAKEEAYLNALKIALESGQKILQDNGTSVEAVEAVTIIMEDSPFFNAGKGSVFTHDGTHEMDAAIMDGNSLKAGAVCGVSHLKNPISVARMVMEKTEYVMLSGRGAESFAKKQGARFADADYFYDESRFQQLQLAKQQKEIFLDHSGENIRSQQNVENGGKKFGTVGAVALDAHGNIAAATSTGGMTNKQFGRIGDTPIIGAGTYANNKTCAISCTGHGEYFMRNVVADDISALMQYKGYSLTKASNYVINEKLKNQEGEGGLVALDAKGNYTMCFNTPGMYRGIVTSESEGKTEIYR